MSKRMRARLHTATQRLLEVRAERDENSDYTVDFMHKSVFEFLESRFHELWYRGVQGERSESSDIPTATMLSCAVQMRKPASDWHLEDQELYDDDLLEDFAHAVHLAEQSSGLASTKVVKKVHQYFSALPDWDVSSDSMYFVALMSQDCGLYFKEQLSDPGLNLLRQYPTFIADIVWITGISLEWPHDRVDICHKMLHRHGLDLHKFEVGVKIMSKENSQEAPVYMHP